MCVFKNWELNARWDMNEWIVLALKLIDNELWLPGKMGRLVTLSLVSCSHTFRLMAEDLEKIAAFIGQGPPIRPFDWHVKQPITVCFVQSHVSGHGNVADQLNI